MPLDSEKSRACGEPASYDSTCYKTYPKHTRQTPGRRKDQHNRSCSSPPSASFAALPTHHTRNWKVGEKGADPHQTKPNQPYRTESNRIEPNRIESNRTKPNQTEPNRTEPNRTEPNRTEPNRTEPSRTEPNRTEPNRTEPNRTEPNRTEPNRTEPNHTNVRCCAWFELHHRPSRY